MTPVEYEFKQRAFDGKWNLWARFVNPEPEFTYFCPVRKKKVFVFHDWWEVINTYDYVGELENE